MNVSPRIGFNGFLTPLVGGKHVPLGRTKVYDIRRSDVPTTQVEFDDGNKSINGVFNIGHWEEGVGMSHETRHL